MAEYLAPGVFVEEVSFQPSQIQPASTSVAAMIGPARFGPVRGVPQLLTSFSDFQNAFGDPSDLAFSDGTVTNYSAYAARAFFDNGGQQLYFGRIVNGAAPPGTASLAVPNSGTALVDFVARFQGSGGNLSLVLQPRRSPRLLQFNAPVFSAPKPTRWPCRFATARPSGKIDAWIGSLIATPSSFHLWTHIVPVCADTWDPSKQLKAQRGGFASAVQTALTGANLPAGVTGIQSLIAIAAQPAAGSTPAAYDFVAGQPIIYVDQVGTQHVAPIANFATGILASAVPTTGAGVPQAVSLQALQGIGSAPLYSVPVGPNMSKLLNVTASVSTLYGTVSDTGTAATVTLRQALNPALSADTTVPLALLAMGSRTGDGNIYHDSYDVSVQRNGLTVYSFAAVCLEPDATNNLQAAMNSRLALYYPWVQIASLAPGGGTILLPPSGFVAGLYANTDITRGVHKAPANVVVQEALGLELAINTAQQDVLNPLGINCLREFTWGGYRVWGARTLSSDPQWQYVNVRRYFLYLEHSLAASTSWVVFEPNGQALWSAVSTSVSDFLYNEWREGRLFGATPAEAFFVRCDMTTMTQADLDDGRLICLIGVAPLEPAEFVIFRIGQYTASSSS